MDEEIILALKNGINNGESLQDTINILIQSGYNAREVQEAANYVGSNAPTKLQIKPEEELIMPEEKGFFNLKIFFRKKNKSLESKSIKIKTIWMKEIILLLVLLLLIGVLIAIIFFKEFFFKLIS